MLRPSRAGIVIQTSQVFFRSGSMHSCEKYKNNDLDIAEHCPFESVNLLLSKRKIHLLLIAASLAFFDQALQPTNIDILSALECHIFSFH
jgi:hypothetical protein